MLVKASCVSNAFSKIYGGMSTGRTLTTRIARSLRTEPRLRFVVEKVPWMQATESKEAAELRFLPPETFLLGPSTAHVSDAWFGGAGLNQSRGPKARDYWSPNEPRLSGLS
jgi:acetyl esterase/lipase